MTVTNKIIVVIALLIGVAMVAYLVSRVIRAIKLHRLVIATLTERGTLITDPNETRQISEDVFPKISDFILNLGLFPKNKNGDHTIHGIIKSDDVLYVVSWVHKLSPADGTSKENYLYVFRILSGVVESAHAIKQISDVYQIPH